MAKIENQSDKHLVVKSLKVLGKVEGGGIETIRENVEALQNAQQTLATKTEDYWTNIASDLTITPEEKKTLYKEYQIIQREYASLVKEAETAGYSDQFTFLKEYKEKYEDLYNYINSKLKVFDSMVSNTMLEDRNTFINYYENYYLKRDTLRSVLYSGTSGIATYSADLTPEQQTIAVDVDGKPISNSALVIQAHLWEGADGADYAVSRKAKYRGLDLGSWDGDTLSFNALSLVDDVNYIYITLTDAEGVDMTAIATVTKIYQSGDRNVYDMELSDNCIQVNTDRTVIEPQYISAKKIVKNNDYTKETDYGYITASIDGGDEKDVSTWTKDDGAKYDENVTYAKEIKFGVLYLDREKTKVLGPDINTAYIFTVKE